MPDAVEMLGYSKLTDEMAYIQRPITDMGPLAGIKKEMGYLPITTFYTDKGVFTDNNYYIRLLWTKIDLDFSTTSGMFLTKADYGMELDTISGAAAPSPG